MTKVKRVLLILTSINLGGGVQSKIMDIYRNIDRNKVQFDFFIQGKSGETFEEEINKLGGKVYYFGDLNEIGKFRYLKYYHGILQNCEYGIVHSFLNINDGIMLYLARKKGIKIRISHVRGAFIDSKMKRKLSPLLRKITIDNATKLLANSEHAGKYFFGNNDYEVLPNAFDIKRYLKKDSAMTNSLMKELNIFNNTLVLGHIGRFSKEKNHFFLIKIANSLREKKVNFKMIFIGSGPLKMQVKKIIEELELQNEIIFIDQTDEVYKYYKLFDLFLFPSLHEGFGNVALEAQASGVPVLASEKIPNEIDLNLGLVNFLSIESIDEWVKTIVSFRKTEIDETIIEKKMIQKGFSIKESVAHYYRIYEIKNSQST